MDCEKEKEKHDYIIISKKKKKRNQLARKKMLLDPRLPRLINMCLSVLFQFLSRSNNGLINADKQRLTNQGLQDHSLLQGVVQGMRDTQPIARVHLTMAGGGL